MNKKLFIGTVAVTVVLIASYFGIKTYTTNSAEQKIRAALKKVTHIVTVDFKKISVEFFRKNVRISDVFVTFADEDKNLYIKEIIIYKIDDKSGIPAFLSVSCNGINIDLKKFDMSDSEVERLGYSSTLLSNFALNYRYYKGKKEFALKKLCISVENAGEISCRVNLNNIDLAVDKLSELKMTYPQISLSRANIVYKNYSLIDRLMKATAKEKNIDFKEFRNTILQRIETIKDEKEEFEVQTLNEIRKFILEPKKLTFFLLPPQPITFKSISKMALKKKTPKEILDFWRMLNLKVTANK